MADSSPYNVTQTHFPISKFNSPFPAKPTGQGKFFANFLSKSLFLALCVFFLPLLPSEAPEFLEKIISTKLWEILRLVFVGIAVSYGLFSRRNVQMEVGTLPNIDHTQSYASISSFFDDAFEIPRGSDEKISIYSKNSYCSLMEVERRNIIDYEPMGLPIRSLKSGIINVERSDFSDGSDSSSGSNCSSTDSMKSGRMEFGDLDLTNLNDNFDEASASSSPSIPWRSRSGRMEMREKVDNDPAHFRPLSVDEHETQYESLKSRSFRSTTSNSSNSSSSELFNFEIKNGVVKRDLSGSSFSTSTAPLTQIKAENQSVSSKELRLKSSNMNTDSTKQDKFPARGVSVRTIRANRVTREAMEVENGGEKIEWINNGSKNLYNAYTLSEQTFRKHDEEMREFSKVLLENSEDLVVRSNQDICSETETDNHEVDKKADEFIAKFREQIKLQKTASMTRSRKNNF